MRSLCACAALAVAGCAWGPKEGWTSLFDGETLDGWQRHEKMPGGEWAAADGVIVGKEGADASGGFLATAGSYRDFIIELDVCMDWPFDSGVFLRVGKDGKSHQVTLDYRPGGEIGGIYVPWGPGFVCHALPAYICGDAPDGIEAFPEGEWNRVKIRIEGEPAHIRFWLNGALVTDFQHSAETTEGIPPEGPICLQVHGGVENAGAAAVRFRNLQIKELQ